TKNRPPQQGVRGSETTRRRRVAAKRHKEERKKAQKSSHKRSKVNPLGGCFFVPFCVPLCAFLRLFLRDDQAFVGNLPVKHFHAFLSSQRRFDISTPPSATEERYAPATTRATHFRCLSSVSKCLCDQQVHLRRGNRRRQTFAHRIRLLHHLGNAIPIVGNQRL